MNQALEPHLLLLDGYYTPKEDFTSMRFLLGLTMVGDGYFANDVIFNHRGANRYDEFETNLGYPRTDAQPVPGTEIDDKAIYARFFDNGVMLVNVTGSQSTVSDTQLQQMSGYAGPYYRFLGGQNPSFNNGELFTSVLLEGEETKGDGIILLSEPRTIVSPIFIDNGEVGTSPSSHQPEFSGNWKRLSEDNAESTQKCHGQYDSWQIAFAPWKDIYPYAFTSDNNATATYRPSIGVAGYYDVYEWHGRYGRCEQQSGEFVWIDDDSEATNTKLEIHHSNGDESLNINQRENYGKWNLLGRYYFNPGTDGYIRLFGDGADGLVIADAFKLVYQDAVETPTFVDVPFSHSYHDDIEVLYQAGYTAGCNTDLLMYCPEKIMNRSESAVFVERGIHSAEYVPPEPTEVVFADVALDAWYANWVHGLWNDGYTAGCGTNPLIYCPDRDHTRAEGCVFYLRMMNGADFEPSPPKGYFKDVDMGMWYAKWVDAAWEAGFAEPCATEPELLFCPDDALTRAAAAYMMVRAKGLIDPSPPPTILPSPSPTPSATPSPTPTEWPTPSATPSATPSPTPTESPTPSATPTSTPTLDPFNEGFVIDHNNTYISLIPEYWLNQAKQLAFHYAHTSHGSQINSGLQAMEQEDSRYDFNTMHAGPNPPSSLTCDPGALCIYDGNPPETYITPSDYWDSDSGRDRTRAVADTGLFGFSMWSWCGQQSSNTEETAQRYLDTITGFESEYSSMRFILMTGHTDGGSATLTRNNDMVRDYAYTHSMILFDFADIESYDPDGNYYPNTSDDCSWCADWCAAHPEDCQHLPSSCAHSHPFNCYRKGQAFCWMMARLAGWDGE